MAMEQAQERKISPKGAHLPQLAVDQALPVARAVQELAAPSTVQRIAQRLGVSPSGGQFRSRVGAAGYFGLIRRVGDRRELTDLGAAALGSGDDALDARRRAVMATGFRSIFGTFRGRDVNEGVVQARLQDDFGVPAAASSLIARALIDSGEQTGLITGGKFDAAAIEEALAAIPVQGDSDSASARRAPSPAATRRPGSTQVTPESSPRHSTTTPPANPPAATGKLSPAVHIDIQIHIPATATGDQIDQIFASMAKHLYARD